MKTKVDISTFVSDTAVIIGKVKIGKNCGVFPNAIIRGDQNSMEIGDGSNIQDCCVIHCDADNPVKIGKNVSIGHCAMVHGATIEDDCLVGIHATILNGAKIKSGTIIGANALVKEGTIIPENSLVIGVPGKAVKQNVEYRKFAQKNAATYRKISKSHLEKKHEYYKVR